MSHCIHRAASHSLVPSFNGLPQFTVWNCSQRGLCTEADHGLKLADESTMPVCDGCPLRELAVTETERAFSGRPWGDGESISGPGSSLDATTEIRDLLPGLLNELGVRSLLDLPCGDFHWMQNVDLPGVQYIGADVVRTIIDDNRSRFPDRDFRQLDLITENLPTVDAIFCRDCLVHLPYHGIGKALQRIVDSGADWLITTHFPGRTNHNIPMGSWRPLDLTAAPFHLPPPVRIINEGCVEGDGGYADKSLGVWRIEDIRSRVNDLNTTPKLTIGMATFRDWPGLWATIESVFLHHADCLPEIEFVIVDNDPAGLPDANTEDDHSSKARRLVDSINRQGLRARYVHFTTVQGTAAAKSQVFAHATGSTVLVVDSHVMLQTGTIRRLINWAESNLDSKDLWQGPCIGLNQIVGTDFAPRWGSLMYGQWNHDARVNHDAPFEIEMQGCGLFACRRKAWPGFHPLLRGFGPEEFHLHQRIRRNGGQCYCLPWLKWCHRFGNPSGSVPPGLRPEERLRGHLITHLDTGAPSLSEIRRHFVDEAKALTDADFLRALAATVNEFFEVTQGRADMGIDCPHRGPYLRQELCQIGCHATRGMFPIFACGRHGECAPWRWEQHQHMMDCRDCVLGSRQNA